MITSILVLWMPPWKTNPKVKQYGTACAYTIKAATSRARGWFPHTHQDSKRNMAQLIKNLFLNSVILDVYTEGTLNTVQGWEGHLKAQGVLTAPREPGHTGPNLSHYTPRVQCEVKLSYRLCPHILLEESAPASFWNDGKHTCSVDNYDQQ